jgi:hypothetical protein
MDTPEDGLVAETCMMNLLIKLYVVLDGSFLNRIKVKNREKGKHLNTLEKYHIYKMSKDRLHMNDTYINTNNPLFEVMQELNTR